MERVAKPDYWPGSGRLANPYYGTFCIVFFSLRNSVQVQHRSLSAASCSEIQDDDGQDNQKKSCSLEEDDDGWGSRRKYKKNRPKVRVAPGVFKPAFTIPEALLASADKNKEWDDAGSVIRNYKSFGVVSNPNLLGVRARTPQIVQCTSLQVPSHDDDQKPFSKFEPVDSGSDLESDDLKSALGKKRKDGKTTPLRSLTTIQRVHVGRLIDKYGDDYQAMFKDIKLNAMQHSVATLKKLCQRYHARGKCLVNSK